jgi:hypothetical protein
MLVKRIVLFLQFAYYWMSHPVFWGGGGCFNKSNVSILVKQTEVRGWNGLMLMNKKYY